MHTSTSFLPPSDPAKLPPPIFNELEPEPKKRKIRPHSMYRDRCKDILHAARALTREGHEFFSVEQLQEMSRLPGTLNAVRISANKLVTTGSLRAKLPLHSRGQRYSLPAELAEEPSQHLEISAKSEAVLPSPRTNSTPDLVAGLDILRYLHDEANLTAEERDIVLRAERLLSDILITRSRVET